MAIGYIALINVPYFDATLQKNSFKRRPALVIGDAGSNDYTALPVSKVNDFNNLSVDFDVKIDPQIYPLLNLSKISHVRTHKVMTVHRAAIVYKLGNMKTSYPDLYLEILAKFEEYGKNLLTNAL